MTRWIDPRRPEASGILKIKISATFDFAISAAADPMVSKVGVLDGAVLKKSTKNIAPERPERSHDTFSICSGMSHTESYFLRALVDGLYPDMVSKVGVLDGAVLKKPGKRHRSATMLSSTVPAHQLKPNGIHPRIPLIPRTPRIPAIRCQELRLGPSLPHAPGARMT